MATSSAAAPSLGEGDQMLVVERAAWQWNGLRAGEAPPEGPAAAMRRDTCLQAFQELLRQAKRRWQIQVIDAQPGISFRTRRTGVAR